MTNIDSSMRPTPGSAQSNSLDAITDFGGEQVDNLPEHNRVKRPDAEPLDAGKPQINY